MTMADENGLDIGLEFDGATQTATLWHFRSTLIDHRREWLRDA